jgi:hypothetical protein
MTGQFVFGPWRLGAGKRQPGYYPPPLEYYAVRCDLGMPSNAEALTRRCPWCHGPEYQRCHVPGTDIPRDPHEARTAP